MLQKSNYELNRKTVLGPGTINGQGCAPVSDMKYGLFHMSFNGCEMIAIYNYLTINKMPNPGLAEICFEMYPVSGLVMGLFGSNPHRLYKYFHNRNIQMQKYTEPEEFFKELKDKKTGIVSFWNAYHPFKGLHTVCVEYRDGKIIVYNRSNLKNSPIEFDEYTAFTDKKRFICGFLKK